MNQSLYLPFTLRMPTRYGEHLEFCNGSQMQFSHQHNGYELCYILNKRVQLEISHVILNLAVQNCIIIAPETMHKIIPTQSDTEYLIMNFSSKLKRTIKSGYYDDALFVRLEQAVTTEYVLHIITDHYNNTTTIEQIKEELVSRKWAYKLLLGNLCSNLLFGILRNFSAELFAGKDMKQYQDNYNLALLINKYISQHFMEPLTTQFVAELFHVSTKQLGRVLEKYYQKSFTQIISLYRLEEAKQLLSTSSLSLEEIAYNIGFTSTRSLYDLFQRYDEKSPNDYRKKYL